MKNKSKHKLVLVIGVLAIIVASAGLAYKGTGAGSNSNSNPTVGNTSNQSAGKYDDFAKCLKDKGAVFYGAAWCPHCQNQKKEFGTSVQYVPYVECSTPDGKGQVQVCIDKDIQGYPTWIFADGSRQSGEVPFATLASKTGCALPQ